MLFAVKMARKSDANKNHMSSSLNIKKSLSFQMICIVRLFNAYLTLEINVYNLTLEISCLHSMKMTANNITQLSITWMISVQPYLRSDSE